MASQNRQEYIRAAIIFLQNPKLVDSTLKDKLKFLRDKGLTEVELDEALNLALVNRHQAQHGKWNYLLMLGLCIGGYKLYQFYLENKEKQRVSKQEEPIKLEHNQEKTYHEHEPLKLDEILKKMSELKKLIELQRSNSAADIQSLKTLLLGHEKFAAPPVIPAWQLKDLDSKEEVNDTTNETAGSSKNDKKKKTRKSGSGHSTNGFNQETVIAPIPQ